MDESAVVELHGAVDELLHDRALKGAVGLDA
jgi:hypothetical protein